jgi:hypothetical protein
LASDDKTTIGSEADTAQLVADSLGLQLNVVQTSWGRLAPGRQLGQVRRGDQQRHRDRGAQEAL